MAVTKSVVYAAIGVSSGLVVPGMFLAPPLTSGNLTPEQRAEYKMREMSSLAIAGMRVYHNTCVSCHGDEGIGTASAPSLQDPRFAGTQSGRQAFHDSLAAGVPHRPLPEIRRLSFNQIEQIARYVREVNMIGDG